MKLPSVAPLFPSPPPPPSVAASPPPPPRGMMPVSAWREYAKRPLDEQIRALPDGTPLQLTALGVHLIQQVTGRLLWPVDVWHAYVILWAASMHPEEAESLWQPPPPEDELDESGQEVGIPALNAPHLAAMARRWANAFIPPGAALHAYNIALHLWNTENETAVEVDTDALPEPDDDAKKAAAGSTGLSPDSTPSPAGIPSSGPASSDSAGAPSSPPTAHGSAPTDSPSSAPLPAPNANAWWSGLSREEIEARRADLLSALAHGQYSGPNHRKAIVELIEEANSLLATT